MSVGFVREPDCVHSGPGTPYIAHPASSCSTCKDGPELRAWIAYWDEHRRRCKRRFCVCGADRLPVPAAPVEGDPQQ